MGCTDIWQWEPLEWPSFAWKCGEINEGWSVSRRCPDCKRPEHSDSNPDFPMLRGDESSWYNYAGQTCSVMCLVSGSWSIDSRPSLPGTFIIIHWCHIRVAPTTLAFGEPMACLFSPVLDNSFTEYHSVFAWSTDAFLEHLNYQATR